MEILHSPSLLAAIGLTTLGGNALAEGFAPDSMVQQHAAETSTAFPTDKPVTNNDGSTTTREFDLYGGPSVANQGQGFGIGIKGTAETRTAWKNNFSSDLYVAFTGGVYGLSAETGKASLDVSILPEWYFGYYDQKSMVEGYGFHLEAVPVAGGADIASNNGALYSYAPKIGMGIHGRDAERASPWSVSLGVGVSLGYATGWQRKLDPATGKLTNFIVDPYFSLYGSTDQKVGSTYLRATVYLFDRVDSLGRFGTRHVLSATAILWIKVLGEYYTGPGGQIFDPSKVPDLATKSYVRANPVLAGSWYFGRAF